MALARALACLTLCALPATALSGQTFDTAAEVSGFAVLASEEAHRTNFDKVAQRSAIDARARVDWTKSAWRVTASVDARAGDVSDHAGLLEGYGQYAVAPERGPEWRFRAGTFFLPTSQEHQNNLWSPAELIHPSVWNSWVGEEVRPIGVDVQTASPTVFGRFHGGVTLFAGNDTAGTLLAWRGWSSSPDVAHAGEKIALPPLASLPTHFPDQARSVTPIGEELDGRIGLSARTGFGTERARIQIAWFDNRGDRQLHGNQYAWATTFVHIGGSAELGRLRLAAEHASGNTGMGNSGGARVDARFATSYVLASMDWRRLVMTGRIERFTIADDDHSIAEINREKGHTFTAAASVRLTRHLEGVVEWSEIIAENEMSASSGFGSDVGGQRLTIAARGRFE